LSAESFHSPAEGQFPTGDPYIASEIQVALRELHQRSVDYLAGMSDEEFLAPQGQHWSPAVHVRHLRRSCRPVAQALAVPRTVLGLRFGKARGESGNFESVVARYHSELAAGGNADGSDFDPPAVAIEGSIGGWRAEVIARWTRAVEAVAERTGDWSERALNRYQLPHPLIGKMTVREILLFTVYHNAHHLRRIAERATAS